MSSWYSCSFIFLPTSFPKQSMWNIETDSSWFGITHIRTRSLTFETYSTSTHLAFDIFASFAFLVFFLRCVLSFILPCILIRMTIIGRNLCYRMTTLDISAYTMFYVKDQVNSIIIIIIRKKNSIFYIPSSYLKLRPLHWIFTGYHWIPVFRAQSPILRFVSHSSFLV